MLLGARISSLFHHESQFPRGLTMSHPNHQRRRNRTFRVEVLESRVLLSTAGVVSRPAAAVAPGARFAQVSSIAGDPKYEGVMTGTGGLPEATKEVHFFTSGAISSKTTTGPGVDAFDGGASEFKGGADTETMKNGKIKYKNGFADIISPDGTNMLTVKFTGLRQMDSFTLQGEVLLGQGVFKRAKGTFSAEGAFIPQQGTAVIMLKLNVTKL
jgi:hypothetical protein